MGGCGRHRARAAPDTYRLPGSHLRRYARHVLRLHHAQRPARHPRGSVGAGRVYRRVAQTTEAEVDAKITGIQRVFEIAQPGRDKISQPVTADGLRWSATRGMRPGPTGRRLRSERAGVLLSRPGRQRQRGVGRQRHRRQLTPDGAGIPAAGKGDLKNCVAMLIIDHFGAGGSYTEFYALDFNEDFVLMGHDGPGRIPDRRWQAGATPGWGSTRQPRLRHLGGVQRRHRPHHHPGADPDR